MELITYSKAKYAEQVVSVMIEGGFNHRLFDACELFMEEDTWRNRKDVFDSGKPKEWAEQFVAQFNAGASAMIAERSKP